MTNEEERMLKAIAKHLKKSAMSIDCRQARVPGERRRRFRHLLSVIRQGIDILLRSALALRHSLFPGALLHSSFALRHATLPACVLVVMTVVLFPPQHSKADPPRSKFRASDFHFARIRFNTLDYSHYFPEMPPWAHDYPRADRNFLKILAEVSGIRCDSEAYQLVSLEDDQIFKYPWAYMCEVGYMNLTAKEVATLRAYLDRGGFIVVDDFRTEREWEIFANEMRRVYPNRGFQELQLNHPVFQCFYNIKTLDMAPPYARYLKPRFLGLSDEKGRLQIVANFNNDIGEYWEWSDTDWMPLELSNEAYKYGINYVMYALTH
jgi:hypothetical protein